MITELCLRNRPKKEKQTKNDKEHKQATADTAKRYINDALKEIEKANAGGRLPTGCYTI